MMVASVIDRLFAPSWKIQDIDLRFSNQTGLSKENLGKISEGLRERFQNAIKEAIIHLEALVHCASDSIDLRIEIQGREVFVYVNDQKILLQDKRVKKLLKEMRSVKNYAQRAGIGCYKNKPFETLEARANRMYPQSLYEANLAQNIDRIIEATIKKPRQKENEVLPNIVAAASIASDSSLVARYILSMMKSYGPRHPLVLFLRNFFSMPILFFTSLYTIVSSFKEMRSSQAIGDKESESEAKRSVFDATALFLGGAFYTASRLVRIFGGHSYVLGLSAASTASFGITGVIGTTISLCNLNRCRHFRARINAFMHNPNISEEQRLTGALKFMRDQITLSDDEIASIIRKINESDLPDDDKKELIVEKTLNTLKRKINHFKRRAGNKSMFKVMAEADVLLRDLKDPRKKVRAMHSARELIRVVKTENHKRTIFYCLMFIASLLSIASLIIASVLSGGTLPLLLAAVSGVIFLSLSLYTSYIWAKGKFVVEDATVLPGLLQNVQHRPF